jgi:hypothetical protein
MGFLKRFLSKLAESDEERLRAEVQEWASSVPNVTPMGEAVLRHRVQVAGVVRRITVWPREGAEPEYLEALLTDGTGEINASWTGRRSIPGLSLGTRLVVEGMLRRDDRGVLTIDNPGFEFAI